MARARGPPLWEPVTEPVAEWGDSPAPVPEFVFDQPLELVAQRTFAAVLGPSPSHRLHGHALPGPSNTVTRIPPVIALHHRWLLRGTLPDRFSSPRRPTLRPA